MLHATKSKREKDIAKVSVIGIISNGFLGGVKIAVGIATNSVAIISDAVNNLTDTSSSIITIIGTHLASRNPDAKHPFGYGRVEYLTSLVIGLLVLFTGVELCKSSIQSIIHPHAVSFTVISAVILAITVVVKIFLGNYTLGQGKKLDSGALKASGLDARSDAVATSAALFAVVLYLWKHISIDAWVGAIISLYIVRTGYLILKDTVSKLVGEAASKQMARQIHERLRQVPIVKGAYDLMINNYGPDFYVGRINVEVDHNLTAEEICRALHPAQVDIYHNLRTIMTIGLYAVDKTSSNTATVDKMLDEFCKSHPCCLGYHGIFVDDESRQVYCDVVVDYGNSHDDIAQQLTDYIAKGMPGYEPVVSVDSPSE